MFSQTNGIIYYEKLVKNEHYCEFVLAFIYLALRSSLFDLHL